MHLVTYPCVYKKCVPSIWGQGHTLGCLSWPRPLIRWATNIITLPICPRSHVASDSGWTLLLFGAAVHTLHCVLLDTNHTVCQTRIKRALQHPCTWLRTSCCSDGNASFNAWAKRTFTWSLDSLKIKSRTHSNRRCKRDKWWSKEQNYKFLKLRLLHLCHAAWPWTEVSDAIFCHTAAWIATQDHTTKNLFGPGKLLVLDGNGASKTKMHFRVPPLNFEGRATSNEKLHCSSRPLCKCLQ